jgi:hypothetical protein
MRLTKGYDIIFKKTGGICIPPVFVCFGFWIGSKIFLLYLASIQGLVHNLGIHMATTNP